MLGSFWQRFAMFGELWSVTVRWRAGKYQACYIINWQREWAEFKVEILLARLDKHHRWLPWVIPVLVFASIPPPTSHLIFTVLREILFQTTIYASRPCHRRNFNWLVWLLFAQKTPEMDCQPCPGEIQSTIKAKWSTFHCYSKLYILNSLNKTDLRSLHVLSAVL